MGRGSRDERTRAGGAGGSSNPLKTTTTANETPSTSGPPRRQRPADWLRSVAAVATSLAGSFPRFVRRDPGRMCRT
jgi:hypothetical protein